MDLAAWYARLWVSRGQPAVLHDHDGIKPDGLVQSARSHDDDGAGVLEAPLHEVLEVWGGVAGLEVVDA